MTTEALEHHALIYGGTADYLEVTVPYLRSGLADGDLVMAVVPEPGFTALQDELGRDREQVTFVKAQDWYLHPVQAIRAYDKVIRSAHPQRVRVVAEPVWRGWKPIDVVEWTRFESVVNVVFATSGARAICPYDQSRLPAELITWARQTHPTVLDPGPARDSCEYLAPEVFAAMCDDRAAPPEPPPDAERLALRSEDDLHLARHFVAGQGGRHGLDPSALSKLVMAVNEAATNALRHGTPPMAVRVWRDGADLVCEIGDHGLWRPGPLTGFLPPHSALDRGFGLWSVRLLVDHMQLRTGWDGTFVVLRMRAPAGR